MALLWRITFISHVVNFIKNNPSHFSHQLHVHENDTKKTKLTKTSASTVVRDGPLEKLWGGEGNFWAAGIFFRFQIPCMNFFQALAWIFLRVNWRARIFFSFNFPLREFFFCTSPAPPISFLMVRPLGD